MHMQIDDPKSNLTSINLLKNVPIRDVPAMPSSPMVAKVKPKLCAIWIMVR